MNKYDVTLYNDNDVFLDKVVFHGLAAVDKDAARAFGEKQADYFRQKAAMRIVVHVAWIKAI